MVLATLVAKSEKPPAVAAVSPLCISRATFRVNFVKAGPAAMIFQGQMRMSQIAAWTADSVGLTFQQLLAELSDLGKSRY